MITPDAPPGLTSALEPVVGRVAWVRFPAEMNEVWSSNDRRVVVRIAPPAGQSLVSPEHTVAAARLLEEHRVPAVRLLPGINQPFEIDSRLATAWRYVESDSAPTTTDLARSLRLVHSLPAPVGFPGRDLRPVVARRLEQLRSQAPGRAEYWHLLDEWLARTGPAFDGLEHRVVHGDIRRANVLRRNFEAILLDLDSVSVAPAAFDVWPVVVDHRGGRINRSDYVAFCRTLGADPDVGALFSDFVHLLHLAFTTLDELRHAASCASTWDRRRRTYASWWSAGAPIEDLGGWTNPWT